MMEETTPTNAAPAPAEDSMLDRTKDALADARDAVGNAVSSTLDAAKKHPATTAAVAAGAAAVAAGAAYGISRMRAKEGGK